MSNLNITPTQNTVDLRFGNEELELTFVGGVAGQNGADGTNGADGLDGVQGPAGPQGAAADDFSHWGSLATAEFNGESMNPDTNGLLYWAGSAGNGAGMTGSGSDALFAGDFAISAIVNLPWELYAGLNRTPVIIGTQDTSGTRRWSLSYNGSEANNDPQKFVFTARGETSAGSAWTVKSVTLPDTASGRFVPLVSTNSGATECTLDVYDIGTGTWYEGTPVARPSGFVGIPFITRDLTIGADRSDLFPSNNSGAEQGTDEARATSMRDILITDSVMTQADVESIVQGADPITVAGAANIRFYCPLASSGVKNLTVTSNVTAMAGVNLTQLGQVLPGPTMTRQSAATYLTLDPLKTPALFGMENSGEMAMAQLSGAIGTLTGDMQVQLVHENGAILKDWFKVDYTLSSGEFTTEFPIPRFDDFCFKVKVGGNDDYIASTHVFCHTVKVPMVASQSEVNLATLVQSSATGRDTTLNIRPEGNISNIFFLYKRSGGAEKYSIIYAQDKPGLLGDAGVTIANYLARNNDSAIAFIVNSVSGTSINALLDDSDTSRTWADFKARGELLQNKAASGGIPLNSVIYGGWEAFAGSSPTTDFHSEYFPPLLWGQGTTRVPQDEIDHHLSDGDFDTGWTFVIMPPNRATNTTNQTTDASAEADQRDGIRNFAHLYGAIIAPETTLHKMENETTSITATTHPANNDLEGDVEMARAVAEACCLGLGTGTYAGPQFVENVETGSALNKIIVNIGAPKPYPEVPTHYRPYPASSKLVTKGGVANCSKGFEAEITDGGGYSINNVTSGTILNGRQIELTLSANYVAGETKIKYHPGTPGSYGNNVSQQDWRDEGLLIDGFPLAGGNTAIELPA